MNAFKMALNAMPWEKEKALRDRIGDDAVDALLASLDGKQKAADAAGIRFKSSVSPAKWGMDDLSGYLVSHPTHWF